MTGINIVCWHTAVHRLEFILIMPKFPRGVLPPTVNLAAVILGTVLGARKRISLSKFGGSCGAHILLHLHNKTAPNALCVNFKLPLQHLQVPTQLSLHSLQFKNLTFLTSMKIRTSSQWYKTSTRVGQPSTNS
jgi:hypothetical protein